VWIVKEWQCIPPEVTVKGCKNIRSECQVDEGAECEDGDSDTDC